MENKEGNYPHLRDFAKPDKDEDPLNASEKEGITNPLLEMIDVGEK